MTNEELVSQAAAALNLLDGDGKLVLLDSLTILDLVEELERRGKVSILAASIDAAAFETIESVVKLVAQHAK